MIWYVEVAFTSFALVAVFVVAALCSMAGLITKRDDNPDEEPHEHLHRWAE